MPHPLADGLDADNSNTRERYIYVHGTNQEDQIGNTCQSWLYPSPKSRYG